jgi:uncharacterized protein YjbJ (UPF0337 family)
MNWNVIAGHWKQFEGHIQEEWGKLTDDHLDAVAGKRVQLAGRFQVTYGLAEDQAALQVKLAEQIRSGYSPKLPA